MDRSRRSTLSMGHGGGAEPFAGATFFWCDYCAGAVPAMLRGTIANCGP
jgi:hypothetical protein